MSEQLKNVSVCLFDAYGTLFDVAASARNCADEIGESWFNFSAMWRKKQLEYTWLRTMMGNFSDFWHVTGEALDYTMDNFNMDNPSLRARLMELYLKLDTYPEVCRILSTLKGNGVKTGILSNGSRSMLMSAIRKSQLHDLIDVVYSVDELEVYKVDLRVYQMAVDDLGVKAGEICFQSSNAWDAAGAAFFGYRSVWVNRFSQKPERLGPNAQPAFEIKTLDELPQLIGCRND